MQFGYVWHGVRATYGFTRGRVFFEVKVLDCIAVPRRMSSIPRNLVGPKALTLGEDPFSYGYGGTGKASPI